MLGGAPTFARPQNGGGTYACGKTLARDLLIPTTLRARDRHLFSTREANKTKESEERKNPTDRRKTPPWHRKVSCRSSRCFSLALSLRKPCAATKRQALVTSNFIGVSCVRTRVFHTLLFMFSCLKERKKNNKSKRPVLTRFSRRIFSRDLCIPCVLGGYF